MNLKRDPLDDLFERLRALEMGGKLTPEQHLFDQIFKRLRKLERKAEEMERLKWKILGATSALSLLATVAAKIFLK